MRSSDAGWLLTAIARGGVVELSPEQSEWVDVLASSELVRRAAEPGSERAELERLKQELARMATMNASPDMVGRERGLRTKILELSEKLAESEGAAEVRTIGGGGPYRGGSTEGTRWLLTQRGRALLSDLSPRVVRISNLSLTQFDAEMRALRETFTWRAQRAAAIAAALKSTDQLGRARLSVPIGLSAARGQPAEIARAFDTMFGALRRSTMGYTPEQEAAAAEALCLAVPDLAICEDPRTVQDIQVLRENMRTRFAASQPEDALDAAVLLAGQPGPAQSERIAVATALGHALSARGKVITLPLALIATAGERELADHLPMTIVNLEAAIAREAATPAEQITVAVLLSFPRHEPGAQLEKWRALRQYLARFTPDGMAIAAALLSWLALEPAETLDSLRLASAALQKHRLVNGGAETMTLATKLLVSMSVLAAGTEGDHEEKLALAPVGPWRLPHLGLHASLTALPLASSVLVAFHRTVLDAASEWERTYHPTHSPYVFGGTGGRSYGWG